MRNFLKSLLVLALLVSAGTAYAKWQLRHNADGTSDWVRAGPSLEQETFAVGRHFLTVRLTDVSQYSTTYVPVDVTNAQITLVQSVMLDNIGTADALIQITIMRDATAYANVSNGTAHMTIANLAAGDEVGILDTYTPVRLTDNNHLHTGDVIAISSDGGPAADNGSAAAQFTITIEPK